MTPDTLLAGLCLLLAALAALSAWPRAAAIACLLGFGLAVAAAWSGAAARLVLPGGVAFGLDGLSAWCLAILFAGGAACGLAAARPLGALLVAALGLLLLADDGRVLLVGYAASVALLAGAPGMTRAVLRPMLLGWLALAASLALQAARLGATRLGDAGFAAWRAAPSGGVAAMLLALVAVAGLVPPSGRAIAAHRALDGGQAALLAGPVGVAGFYLAARLVLDLGGHAVPPWWAWPLLLLGVGAALRGAWRSVAASDDPLVALAASAVARQGLALTALGLGLAARAADLPGPAALALGAALLQALVNGLAGPLACLAAGAMQQATGTRHLRRMGGLARRMKVTSGGFAVAALGLSALPPGPGFPAAWMLLAALSAAPRLGGILWQMPLAAIAAGIGLALALDAAMALRLAGIALLGPSRTPRASAAAETGPAPRAGAALPAGLVGLSGLAALAGLFPAAALALALPALRRLIADPPSFAGLDAILVAPPLLLALAAAFAAILRWARPAARPAPAWREAAPPSPPWLPFGDPATLAAADTTRVLRQRLAPLLPALRRFAPGRPPRAARLVDAPRLVLAVCLAVLLAGLAVPGFVAMR